MTERHDGMCREMKKSEMKTKTHRNTRTKFMANNNDKKKRKQELNYLFKEREKNYAKTKLLFQK